MQVVLIAGATFGNQKKKRFQCVWLVYSTFTQSIGFLNRANTSVVCGKMCSMNVLAEANAVFREFLGMTNGQRTKNGHCRLANAVDMKWRGSYIE